MITKRYNADTAYQNLPKEEKQCNYKNNIILCDKYNSSWGYNLDSCYFISIFFTLHIYFLRSVFSLHILQCKLRPDVSFLLQYFNLRKHTFLDLNESHEIDIWQILVKS